MTSEFQRRGALALFALPVATSLLASSPAEAATEEASPVSVDVWMRVNRLVQTYSDCIDRVDFDGLLKIFTTDAAYEFGPGLAAHGRAGIREFLTPILARYTGTITFMSTPNVTQGSTAGTYVSWTSFMANHNWKNGNHHSVYGRYVDEFQPDKESGALLIARRRVVSQLSENDGTPRYLLDRNS